MSDILLKNQSKYEINFILKGSKDINTYKVFHSISVAESNLNEFYKENSINKGIGILSEILESNLSSNAKNIISIILNKSLECYFKSDNKIKCILNFFFKKFENKFSKIFISKDITQKLYYELYNPHSLTRYYYLELIKILPNLVLNKLELIHSVITFSPLYFLIWLFFICLFNYLFFYL